MNVILCINKYSRGFLKEARTDDVYSSLIRRKSEVGGFQRILDNRYEVDNRWIVSYCPFIPKIFYVGMNTEIFNCVKSIKYGYKYVNKGSYPAMFAIQQQYNVDETCNYRQGRYISSDEIFWSIFSFPVHERYPAVQ